MNRFHELRAQAFAAVDDVLGELIEVRPKISSQYKGKTADVSRYVVQFTAMLRIGENEVADLGIRGNSEFSQIGTGGAVLAIAPAALSGFKIEKGDLVVALDRPGQPKFSVVRNGSRSHRRQLFELTAQG